MILTSSPYHLTKNNAPDSVCIHALLTVFDSVKDHLSVVGRDYRYRQVNSAYERAFGVSRESIVGKRIDEIFGKQVFNEVIKPKLDACFAGETVCYRKAFDFPGYGGERFMEVRYHPIFSQDSEEHTTVVAVVVSVHDLTLMKKTADQLNDLTRIDALTGLPNRQSVNEALKHHVAELQTHGEEFTVMYLDLDDFRLLIDLHGQRITDELLHGLGQRFRDCFRKDEFIGRYGEDVFIALLPGHLEDSEVSRFQERLLMDIERPMNVLGHVIKPRMSIGAAIAPTDGEDVETLLNQANQTMCRHKASRKSVVQARQYF